MSVFLLDGLKFYYNCDEASGTRADSSVNGLDVAQFGNVASIAGVLNSAIDSTGNVVNYLEAANDPGFRISGDFSFSGWIFIGTGTQFSNHPLAALWANTDRGWLVFFQNSNDRLSFALGNPGGTTSTTLSWNVAHTFDVWTHIYCQYDSGNNQMGISENNQTLITGSFVGTPNPASGSAVFNLTAFRGSSFIVGTNNIDEMGAWDRLLTAEERTTLFGGGTPPSFSTFVSSTGAADANTIAADSSLLYYRR